MFTLFQLQYLKSIFTNLVRQLYEMNIKCIENEIVKTCFNDN